jgi:uncharacterized repeat protein (TIGR02543 family)
MAAGETYTPDDTITLPALDAGEVFVIDGAKEGDPITISNLDNNSEGPLFFVSENNKGTYVFKNLIIVADGGCAIEMGIGNGSDTVRFENVEFYGNRAMTIDSNCSELIVDGCFFDNGYQTHIQINRGTLSLTNSVLTSYYSCVTSFTEGKVAIDNCYFESSGDIALFSRSDSKTDLTISHCTFNAIAGYHCMWVDIADGSAGNTIKLSYSSFVWGWNAGVNGPAVFVEGNGRGTISIERCGFEGLESPNYPIVHLDCSMSFLIADTSFCWNETGTTGEPGYPTLLITGMEGRIVNSTFWGNHIQSSGGEMGCVVLDGAHVDLINNTFLDNYYVISQTSEMFLPVSLQISSTSSVNLINNILVCGDGDGGSTILGDTNRIMFSGGNIDRTNPDVYSDIFVFTEWNEGFLVGCDLPERYRYDMRTVSIKPGGEADGKGIVHSGTPPQDQRGKDRHGKPDIGSITIKTAVFDANGGYWDPSEIYTDYSWDRYYNLWGDAGVDSGYLRLVAAAGEDDLIWLPFYYEYTILHRPPSEQRFIGWGLTPGPGLPDPMFVDLWGTMLGDFAVDTTYYAKWSEGFVMVFDPLNGLDPVVRAAGPNGTVSVPTFGIVNGMALTKWTWDIEGMEDWDLQGPVECNIIVYGQWTPVSSTVTVEFRDGESSNTVYVERDTPVLRPADPVKDGYVFQGWFTAATGGTEWDFGNPVSRNIILYAQWEEALVFTVTFNPCNGGEVFSVEVEKGGTVYMPAIPILKDNVFMGWFTAAEGGTMWDFTSGITKNITLYAQWKPATGGEDEVWIDIGESVVIIAAIVAAALASLGVAGVAGVIGGASGALTQASTAHVFQQGMGTEGTGEERSGEEKNRRSVVFDPRNGKSVWTSIVFIGRLADRPGAPAAPRGKVFSHWSETPDGPPFNFMTPITKLTHLFAVYIPKE